MVGTISLILFVMSLGMVLCFLDESGKKHFLSKIIDKLIERESK